MIAGKMAGVGRTGMSNIQLYCRISKLIMLLDLLADNNNQSSVSAGQLCSKLPFLFIIRIKGGKANIIRKNMLLYP